MSYRFNVYNTVNVTLANQEFGKISTQEVQVARYLDLLHSVRLPKEGDEALISFENIIAVSDVDHSIESVRNNQNAPTPLFGERIEMLRLTQA